MSPQNLLRRTIVGTVLVPTWFITMIGGWGDIGRALAGEARAGELGSGVVAEELRGSVLAGGAELGMPTRLEVVGHEIVVLDRYRIEPIVALDRRSGRLLRGFGREGAGPGEFRSPVSLVVDGSRVAVLDVGLNRVTWLGGGADAFTLRGTTQLELESTVTNFIVLPGGDLLVSGFFADGRLARVRREGGPVDYVGQAQAVELDDLPPARRIEALQGTLRVGPVGDRAVRTHRFASRIEILDTRTFASASTWGPERFAPRSGNDETRFGYLDAAPFSEGFFALYSGRTREGYPGRANYGSVVHEFGWDGSLRAEHRLDADVIAIAWSEEDGLLYAARHDPEPEIVVYSPGG